MRARAARPHPALEADDAAALSVCSECLSLRQAIANVDLAFTAEESAFLLTRQGTTGDGARCSILAGSRAARAAMAAAPALVTDSDVCRSCAAYPLTISTRFGMRSCRRSS
jgi:hypothetical protein